MTNQSKKNDCKNEFSYNEALQDMKKELHKLLETSPGIIREYTRHLSKGTGKLMRARSLLICAQNERDFISQNAIMLASAIEILHLATLVHDDVIDDADMRRGFVSLKKKYGNRRAVICGDYLLSLALKTVAMVSQKEEYKEEYSDKKIPNFIGRICLGELSQYLNNDNFDLSVFQYLKIISGKTAAMFEAAFYVGASLVEKEEIIAKKYAKIGRYVGMVFQLTDDCMDFETTKKVARKPVKSDYEKNIITLPLIYTFKMLEGFKAKAKSGRLPRGEIDTMVKRAGGLLYTRKIARGYQKKATVLVEDLHISENKKEKMISIINKAYRVF